MNSKDKTNPSSGRTSPPKKKRKAKYFPNDIDRVQKETFSEVPAEYVFDVIVGYWQLPSSVQYLIRATTKTGKVKEFTYQRANAARNRLQQLLKEGCTEVLLCDDDVVMQIGTKELTDYDLFDF
jgi:hypothetical protein